MRAIRSRLGAGTRAITVVSLPTMTDAGMSPTVTRGRPARAKFLPWIRSSPPGIAATGSTRAISGRVLEFLVKGIPNRD